MTAPMTRDQERAFIEKLEAIHAEASVDVAERIKGSEHILEGRIIAQAAPSPILTFDPEADWRDIAFYTMAHQAVGVLIASRKRLIDYIVRRCPPPDLGDPPATPEQQEAQKPFSFAQNCAIYCGKPMFQKFMFEVHGLDHAHDQQRMRTKLHSLLRIKSRTELDEDEQARNAWIDLRGAYEMWRAARL